MGRPDPCRAGEDSHLADRRVREVAGKAASAAAQARRAGVVEDSRPLQEFAMRAVFAMGVMGLAVGCGKEPSAACAGYVAAADTCFSAADAAGLDVDVEQVSAEEFCLELFPDVEDARWTCEAAAFQSDDCSTEAGFAAVLAAREDCEAGG